MAASPNDVIPGGKTGKGGGGGGPYLAKVVSHLDPTYMGMLEVEIYRPVGNAGDNTEGQLHQVKMISPFYGVTGAEFIAKEPDDYNNTQKSYGMWFVPPDVGTTVLIFFIDGDPKKGYWLGCVPDEGMNFMCPGIAATQSVVDGDGVRMPVAEYNKSAHEEVKDVTAVPKAVHPLAETLTTQGLLKDDIRGITTSSSRREVPSMVFGLSTPGPVDKRSGAKKGSVGKKESKVDGVFVSRLGGTTLVFDDGDDKFLRKKPAGGEDAGPPEYASVQQGDTDGIPTIPNNELVRLRTRTGHQLLFHNSEDLIYIGNARGTTWIELTSNGKIDIYANDSISIHSSNDLNIRADRDINLEAGRNLNVKTGNDCHIETVKNLTLLVTETGLITAKGLGIKTTSENISLHSAKDTTFKSAKNHIETAATKIHMNGPAAPSVEPAKPLKVHSLPTEVKDETITSILRRVPTHEPYPQHENLDPVAYSSDNTDRDVGDRFKEKADEDPTDTLKTPAEWWTKIYEGDKPVYTTIIDPFVKTKGTEGSDQNSDQGGG